MTFKQRLFAKIKIDPADPDGCWLWTAATDRYGYGMIGRDGRTTLAYHATYELYHGPIPPGARLTHVCRTRGCVRPDHLEPQTFEQRLLSKISVDPADPEGCWLWVAGTDKDGYGTISRDGRTTRAYHATFELYHGPVPAGKILDHVCRVKSCVNPDHLRVSTNKENMENRSGAQRNNRSSGVRGVTWHKRDGRWQVQVQHNGRYHFGGLFDSLDAAAEAARALRLKLFTHNDLDRRAEGEAAA